MLALAIVFTLLFVAVAAVLAILSVHGPNSLPAVALIYLIAANGVWWWSFAQFRRRGFNTLYFLLEGFGLIALGAVFGGTSYLLSDLYERYKTTNTKITEVRDEPWRDEGGQPIGMRFEFSAEFPVGDYYYIEPYLQPSSEYASKIGPRIPSRTYRLSPIHMRVVEKSVEPFPSREDPESFKQYQSDIPAFGLRFDRGVVYRFRFALAPSYLRKDKGGNFCIAYPDERNYAPSREVFDAVTQIDVPTKYEVRVSGTPYGNWRWEGPTAETANEYVPKTFYDSIMAGNPPPCDPSQFVVY